MGYDTTSACSQQTDAGMIAQPHPCSPSPGKQIPNRRAYPIEEARALLGGISRKSIYDLIQSGDLPSMYVAGRRLVPAESIDALIAATTERKAAPEAT
jgi:hypothetical protein